MIALLKYIRFCFFYTSYIFAVIAGGCGRSDAHTVEGAMERAARALESGDRAALYPVLDRRARAALISIVADRTTSAAAVRADYPVAEQAGALEALGDAARASDPAALFAMRCDATCIAEMAAGVGAPASQTREGDELVVRTVQGGSLRLHQGKDGVFGIVFRTRELSDERLRAARERLQIKANAEVYRRRRGLEAATPP